MRGVGLPNRTPGGNGHRSWRQEELARALGWPSEYLVATRESWPYPTNYKIDVAEPLFKIAIEVGNYASKLKEQWYADNGWTYLHFSNRLVELALDECLATVRSTISRLQAITISLPTVSS